MGYFVAQSKFDPTRRARSITLALLVPIALHGLYDFPLLSLDSFQKQAEKGADIPGSLTALLPITLISLAVEIALGLAMIKRLRKAQLAHHAMARGEHPHLMYDRPQTSRAMTGWLLILLGTPIATAGGLGLGAMLLLLLFDRESRADAGGVLIVGALAAFATAIGMALFWSGCSKLYRNESARQGIPVSRH
jgi:hypothetical protein